MICLKKIGIFLIAMFAFMAITSFYLTTQAKQNLTGSVSVKRAPIVEAIELFDDDDGGTTIPTTELTPMDEMTIRITVNFTDPGYIYSVKVIIFYDAVGVDAPDNASHHVTISWYSGGGGWSLSAGGSTTWALDTTNSSVPTYQISGIDYIYVVFTPGKIARYSATGNWVIYANVTDSDNPNLLYGENNVTGYNCRYYLEFSVDATTFDFGKVPPGVTNASMISPSSINVTVISNYYWNLTLNATGWYNASNPTQLIVDFSLFNSLLADDDPYAEEATDSGTLIPKWIKPTGTSWQLDPTPEDGTVVHIYLFVTLPSDIPYGDYVTTLSIIVEGLL